nr:Tn3 family transposase [Rhizobium favelukesii]
MFLCRYLRQEAFRQEIHEGLNVVENWNSANGFVFFGKGGEIATNRIDEQEISALALHLLQGVTGLCEHPHAADRPGGAEMG